MNNPSVFLQPRNPIEDLKQLTFPYTPQIEYSNDVKYDTYQTVHTNYQLYGYTRTENPQITLNCKFTTHTQEHYDMSAFAIRFLRTYTKMNYGRQDVNRGQVPRILRFYAYGDGAFHDVPVVISKFNMTFPDDVDYVSPDISSTGAIDEPNITPNYLPTVFQIHISLLVQQNLYRTVNEFSLNEFAAGKLSNKGYI